MTVFTLCGLSGEALVVYLLVIIGCAAIKQNILLVQGRLAVNMAPALLAPNVISCVQCLVHDRDQLLCSNTCKRLHTWLYTSL